MKLCTNQQLTKNKVYPVFLTSKYEHFYFKIFNIRHTAQIKKKFKPVMPKVVLTETSFVDSCLLDKY